MSLKAFHIFFVSLSTVLALGFSAWCFAQYRADGSGLFALTAGASALSGVGLILYGRSFLKKLEGVSYL